MRTVFSCVYWQTKNDYSVYVMRQASRRSWRIGQTRPVKVVFMSYRNTLQADALKLVAKKLQSSLAVEGELPEDGLAAYGDDGDDLMMALARKLVLDHDRGIVSGDEDAEAETVEEVFAQARDAESAAEELMVDDGWKLVESLPRAGHGVEPEAVGVNSLPRTGYEGNGTNDNGNGHHDANSLPRTGCGGIGPAVELVLGNGHHANGKENGHAAIPVNGNGHHKRPRSRSGRCFPGRSSWPRSR